MFPPDVLFFFFFNDTATTEIYTLSLHDALPIYRFFEAARVKTFTHERLKWIHDYLLSSAQTLALGGLSGPKRERSEEHTSELQSRLHIVCRLLLEKKKIQRSDNP